MHPVAGNGEREGERKRDSGGKLLVYNASTTKPRDIQDIVTKEHLQGLQRKQQKIKKKKKIPPFPVCACKHQIVLVLSYLISGKGLLPTRISVA